MSGAFQPGAERLAGIAGALLGWRPAEFWAATPAELATIISAIVGDADVSPPDAGERARLMEMFPDG